MAAADMIPPPERRDRLRVIIEKPFGHDVESAHALVNR